MQEVFLAHPVFTVLCKWQCLFLVFASEGLAAQHFHYRLYNEKRLLILIPWDGDEIILTKFIPLRQKLYDKNKVRQMLGRPQFQGCSAHFTFD